ncbi:hypothetical protein MGN70_004683 [Eutypa lata]|nr:hypothetical protein MGN70_004683 [Eutypa lata]
MQGPIEFGEAGAVQQMDSARRFPQFSLLPVELRMKIWKDAIETPRIIHIGSRDKVDTSTCVVFNDNLCVQVVEMFLVNAESRAAAFEYPFIHFSVLPDPDDSDEFHFLVTPNDIVSMGAVCPMRWYAGNTVFSCRGDAHLVRNMMINWNTEQLALDLQLLSISEGLGSLLQMARDCIQAFGNRDSLRHIYCLMQDEN